MKGLYNTMYPSKIRQRIANNELLLGTAMFTTEPHVAAAIYQTDPDWVWIDLEHSPWGTESIGMICIMARQAGVAGVIRVPWNTPGDTYAKYPPIGERGIAPWFASVMGVDSGQVLANANNETMLILQMESAESYEKIDDILKIEHFEVLLVGPADLSASLGVPGQIHHSKVENAMLDVAQKLKGTGKALATTFANVEDCHRWIGEGYRMMNVGSTLVHGTMATQRIFADLREEFGP